jgi:membrane associated rhomboid family serine protease
MQGAPLADLPRYPAISGTCLIALGIFAIATPDQIEPLQLDLRAVDLHGGEPWRLLTSALLHAGQLRSEGRLAGLVHVGFNCYWLWLLGVGVEQRLGHLRTLGLIALFAVGGSLLEYAGSGPAVGLSGVVYGFVGLLWVLSRHSSAWRGGLDRRTAQFFLGWFGFCVVATITKVFPIANFAHAGGAILGALIGWAMIERGRRRTPQRLAAIAAVVATFGTFAVGATVARPWVNLSTRAGLDAMVLAERAKANDDLRAAITWAERGVGYLRTPADHWAYLGWLYYLDGRYVQARDAYAEAVRRDPDNTDYQKALVQFEQIAGQLEQLEQLDQGGQT